MLKFNMTDNVAANVLMGNSVIPYKCTVCRTSGHTNINHVYYRVWDHMEDFNDLQKTTLQFVKDNDNDFAATRKRHKRKERLHEEMARKQLHCGRMVILDGLKKTEWNGMKAKVIGKREVRNG